MIPRYFMHDEALTRALAALPGYTRWVNLPLTIGTSVLLTAALGVLGLVITTPRVARDAHWTGRAQALYSARWFAACWTALALVCCSAAAWFFAGPLGVLPRWAVVALVATATFATGFVLRAAVERRARGGEVSFGRSVRGTLVSATVQFPHLWVAIALASVMPARLDAGGWIGLVVGVLVLLPLAAGSGLFIARGLGLAREGSPRLKSALSAAETRTGVTSKGAYELPMTAANAFAFPWVGRVAVTTPAIEALSDEELSAVLCHELGHISEPLSIRALRLFSLAVFTAPLVAWRPIFTAGGIVGLYAAVVAGFVLVALVGRVYRRMETRADAIAHGGEKGEADGVARTYARALEALYRVNVMPAVMPQKRPLHGHLYDRLEKAGMKPEYPRPEAPRMRRAYAVVLLFTVALAGVGFGGRIALNAAGGHQEERLRAVVFTAGQGRSLGDLAFAKYNNGELEAAAVFYRAAMVAEPDTPWHPANLAVVLGNSDRCDECAQALREAEARLEGESRSATEATRVVGLARQSLARCVGDARGRED